MPWGNGPISAATQKRILKEKRLVNAKAKKLQEARVKKMLKTDFDFMHGILAWRAIYHFTEREDMWPTALMVLLIMDTHKIFLARDAYMYGLVVAQPHLHRLMKYTRERGLIDYNTAVRNKHYFITIKGQLLVKEFKDFYKKRTKEILKSNAHGNTDIIYKCATLKAKGSHQFDTTGEG